MEPIASPAGALSASEPGRRRTPPVEEPGSPALAAPLPAASQRSLAEAQPAPVAEPAPAWVVAANLVLTLVCALAIATVLGLTVGPRFFAYETFIVRSGSMEPEIRTGSIVVVQPVQPREIKVGDVITYRRPQDPENTITHRVIEVRSSEGLPAAAPTFRTKGDANNAPDPWEVQLQGIAWRKVFSVPHAGYLFAFTQQRTGRVLFLLVPGLGLAALWVHRTWLNLRRGGAAAGAPARR